MAEPTSTFVGIIVIDQLPHDPRAAWAEEMGEPSELRQALLCLARRWPLDASIEEFSEELVGLPSRPGQMPKASAHRQSASYLSARIDRLIAELNAEATELAQQIELAKRD